MAETQILPDAIVGKSDIARLKHQVIELNEQLHQQRLKKDEAQTPPIHQLIEQTAQALGFEITDEVQRNNFLEKLEDITANAPVINISFAVTPKPAALQKIIHWFRAEIHPLVLIQIGLQPSIAAGCIVRTPNKQFDFSLRQFLQGKHDLLVKSVRGEA